GTAHEYENEQGECHRIAVKPLVEGEGAKRFDDSEYQGGHQGAAGRSHTAKNDNGQSRVWRHAAHGGFDEDGEQGYPDTGKAGQGRTDEEVEVADRAQANAERLSHLGV